MFSANIQKDISIQGRCYVTQNRLCFYSNIIGFVNVVVILLSNVTQISNKLGSFSNTVTLTTPAGTVF
jgi:uncharacterized membrane protein YkgB